MISPAGIRDARGISLVEVLVAVGIVGVLAGTTMLVMPSVVAMAKADSGASQLATVLRNAREQAVTERRNIQISFVVPNIVEVRRENLGAGPGNTVVVTGQTLLSRTTLEQGMEFARFAPPQPDTPDGFAPAAGTIVFTGVPPWQYTPEGTLVSQSGDPVNGTIFLGNPIDPNSAHAITLFGATALLREWRWNGARWVE